MSKIGLIVEREYVSRVRKKSFIIMSLLAPVLFAAMMVLPAWLNQVNDIPEQRIAIIDYTGEYVGHITDTEALKFVYLDKEQESRFREDISSTGYAAYLVISKDLLLDRNGGTIYSEAQVSIDVIRHISHHLNQVIRTKKLKQFNIDGFKQKMDEVNALRVNLKSVKLGDGGSSKESSAEITMVIAVMFSLMIYMFIFMYGAQVMRGVMEEKSNRIVEVIISSVKPFELMMGKILGVGLVALTQFVIWLLLTFSILFIVKTVVFPVETMPTRVDGAMEMVTEAGGTNSAAAAQFYDILKMVNGVDLVKTLISFLLYFIGGYLVYAALFAAVGSAIDVESDTQQFMLPLTIPLILSMYVAMTAFRNPGGDLAFWFSMVPLTSPVVMMARVPFDISIWELVGSLSILYGFFILATWFAARVYRTGILIYGKKVNLKEIWKWFLYSNR